MTSDSSDDPVTGSRQIDLDIGRLRLDRAVAGWIEAHKRDYEINGWDTADAVQDLLTVAYHRDAQRQTAHGDQESWVDAYRKAMAARTPEQIRAEETMNALWNLAIGMSEVESGLRAAARLGLRVRWTVDGEEVPEPSAWPRPHLDEDETGAAAQDHQ